MTFVFDLLTADLLVAAAVVGVAGLIRGFAGFGSGMMMAPVLAILFGPVETVAIVTLLEIAASVQLVPKALGDVEWRFVGPLGAVAILFMPLGAYALGTIDPAVMTRVMAGIVLVFVLVLATGWRYQGPKRILPTLGVGAVSGALLAATTVGNPPVLLYMLGSQDSAATNRANIIAYFAVTSVALLAVLAAMDLLSWPPVVRALMLTPGYLLAAWVGSRLFRRAGEALYRRSALALLFAVAIYGLLR
jgi:uncharacterized membrane protein YfcA